MKHTERLTVSFRDRVVGYLTMTPDNKLCAFEYSGLWLADGFSISPLQLPLKKGIFIADAQPFYGNFGIFEDSMPDGYGRYLLHKALAREGIDDRSLNPLDRLSIVGENGMGALTYTPARKVRSEPTITDFDLLQSKAIEVLREQQDSDAGLLLYNSGNSGGARPKAIFKDRDGHWLIKFRHIYDPADIGPQEFAYNMAAQQAGIIVPDFKLTNGRYFTSRRFDISADGQRIHIATAGALMGLSLSEPLLDYSNLLALTGFLTHNHEDVRQMFRRMIFNYLVDNKDDHCKNFSFLVDEDGKWRLAPAYDLTFNSEGCNGEHATSVNGTGRPVIDDFIAVGVKARIPEADCLQIINEVKSACRPIIRYPID